MMTKTILVHVTTYALLAACFSAFAQENLQNRFEEAVKKEGAIRQNAKLIEKNHLSALETYGFCLKNAQASKSPSASQCDYLIPATLTGFNDFEGAQMLLKTAEQETDAILSEAEERKVIVSARYFRTCATSGIAADVCGKRMVWLESRK